MIDRNQLKMTGSYGIATGGAVRDQVLLAVAADFEAAVMRKIEALSPADIAARYAGQDQVLVTTKYDGESTYIYIENAQEPFCFSANSGRVRLGFSALGSLASKLHAAGVKKALLRAELILPSSSDFTRRMGVADVIRASFSGNQADIDALQLVLLDCVMLDGKNLRSQQTDFAQTLALMQAWVGSDPSQSVFCMAAEVAPESALPEKFASVIEAGGEGIVVRRLNRQELKKIKPHKSIDAVVLGFVEGDFEGKYGVASLLTGLVYPLEDGSQAFVQTFVRAGSGLSDVQRVQMLDQLRPLKIDAPLAMTDSSGRTIQFIKPRLTAELHGEDIIVQENGRDVRTQLLRWDQANERYEFLGLSSCPRLSFARFAKMREDKVWNAGGARIEQVVHNASRPQPVLGDHRAKIIRRELYAKGEMLRKLVVVQKADPELPFPFLLYWTDYSAKRAEPLKVSLQVAADAERAEKIAEKLLQEELTKGFVRI
jgi:ATP-dependent DNA ligase